MGGGGDGYVFETNWGYVLETKSVIVYVFGTNYVITKKLNDNKSPKVDRPSAAQEIKEILASTPLTHILAWDTCLKINRVAEVAQVVSIYCGKTLFFWHKTFLFTTSVPK